MAEPSIVGAVHANVLIRLMLVRELLCEKYGRVYDAMEDEVDDEFVLLVDHTSIQTLLTCVQQKVLDPKFSMKKAIISKMDAPKDVS